MTRYTVQPFDPLTATRAEWAAFHAFRRARAEEDDPGEPVEADAECEYGLTFHWPLYENRRWLAWADGAIIGSIRSGFRRLGTQDYETHAPYVGAGGGVRQAWRRQGVATALLRPFHAFMLERDKTVATFWARLPEGHAFLEAIGAVIKHRGIENRLKFAGLDWSELNDWHANAIPPGSGLTWEIHAGRMPIERFMTLRPQINALMGDVPLGTLDTPPIQWEVEGFRTYYKELDRHGGAHYFTLLMDGDQIAALCEASFDARYPNRVYQNLTATARAWRGRGLAKGVKAAMLRMIRERHPDASIMITGNAQVNAAMLAINHRLGFVEHHRDGTYQIGPDGLAAWIATRSRSPVGGGRVNRTIGAED